MVDMDKKEQILHYHRIDGLSQREIARRVAEEFWPTIWNLKRASLSEKMARLHDFDLFTSIK